MVDAVLAQAGLRLTDMDALAFGRGPGAFTGVRLATSVAQGLAYGAGLPVVAVSDLAAVAQRAFDEEQLLQQCWFATMRACSEVYWACFDRDGAGLAQLSGAEHVGAAAAIVPAAALARVALAAPGAAFASIRPLALSPGCMATCDGVLPRAH